MKKVILTLCSLALLSVSCKKDDNNNSVNTPQGGTGKYLVKTTFKNPDGKSGSSYLQLTNDLNASTALDSKLAIQVPYMSSVMTYGNEVYLMDAIDGSYGVKKFIYSPANQQLSEAKSLNTPAHSMPCNLIKISDTKAYLPLYNAPKVWIVNPQTMEKTGEIDIQKYAHADSSPDAGYGVVRDGYYYLPLLQLGPDYAPYADHFQSDVLIINVQTDKVEKIISETTSHLAMPSQPSYKTCIFTTENKDIYIMCAGYFGFNPANKHSGLVCIPKSATISATEFDSSKSWDISGTIIEGTTYKPATIYSIEYLGNGKAVAFVGVSELNIKDPFTDKNGIAVLINLNAKTIKKIDGIPYTDSHSVFIGKNNNEVIFGVSGTDKRGLFSYNPTTNTTQQLLKTDGGADFFYAF